MTITNLIFWNQCLCEASKFRFVHCRYLNCSVELILKLTHAVMYLRFLITMLENIKIMSPTCNSQRLCKLSLVALYTIFLSYSLNHQWKQFDWQYKYIYVCWLYFCILVHFSWWICVKKWFYQNLCLNTQLWNGHYWYFPCSFCFH